MRQRRTEDRITALGLLLLDRILIERRSGRYSRNNAQLLIRQELEPIFHHVYRHKFWDGHGSPCLMKLFKNDDEDLKVQVCSRDLLDYEDALVPLQTYLETYLDFSLAFITVKVILSTWQRMLRAFLAYGGGDCRHTYVPYSVSVLTVRIDWTYIILCSSD